MAKKIPGHIPCKGWPKKSKHDKNKVFFVYGIGRIVDGVIVLNKRVGGEVKAKLSLEEIIADARNAQDGDT